jgi:Ca2+-binding EF-hand superfamily protein
MTDHKAVQTRHPIRLDVAVALLAVGAILWLDGIPARAKAVKSISPGAENTAFEFLQSFDADRDGQLSRAEFLKAHDTMFEIMDASGDGKIDERELKYDPGRLYGEQARWAAGTVQRYDANGDGLLSTEEAPFGSTTFARADADGNGQADRRELTQLSFDLVLLTRDLRNENPSKLTAAFLKKYDRTGDGKIAPDEFEWNKDVFARYDRDNNGLLQGEELSRIPALPPGPKSQARELIAQRDRDGDGRLSGEEYGEAPERFHATDLNADGWLSLDELASTFEPPVKLRSGRSPKRLLEALPDRLAARVRPAKALQAKPQKTRPDAVAPLAPRKAPEPAANPKW